MRNDKWTFSARHLSAPYLVNGLLISSLAKRRPRWTFLDAQTNANGSTEKQSNCCQHVRSLKRWRTVKRRRVDEMKGRLKWPPLLPLVPTPQLIEVEFQRSSWRSVKKASSDEKTHQGVINDIGKSRFHKGATDPTLTPHLAIITGLPYSWLDSRYLVIVKTGFDEKRSSRAKNMGKHRNRCQSATDKAKTNTVNFGSAPKQDSYTEQGPSHKLALSNNARRVRRQRQFDF